MIPMRTRSPSLSDPSHAIPPLPGAPPGSLWYNSLSPPPPPLLPFNSPLIPTLQTAGRATPPNLTSCCYTNLLTFGLLVAFRPCSLRVQPVPRPTLDNEFMPISPPIQTLPKKLRGHLSPRLICFVTPKVSSFPSDSWSIYPYSLGGWFV